MHYNLYAYWNYGIHTGTGTRVPVPVPGYRYLGTRAPGYRCYKCCTGTRVCIFPLRTVPSVTVRSCHTISSPHNSIWEPDVEIACRYTQTDTGRAVRRPSRGPERRLPRRRTTPAHKYAYPAAPAGYPTLKTIIWGRGPKFCCRG